MQDPLREIYEICDLGVGHHSMTKEEQAVWDNAQTILGVNAVDELLNAQCRSLVEAQYAYFCAGFRLCARLLLEIK